MIRESVYDRPKAAIQMAVLRNLMPPLIIILVILIAVAVGGWLIAGFAFVGLVCGVGTRVAGLGGEGLLKRHRRSTPP